MAGPELSPKEINKYVTFGIATLINSNRLVHPEELTQTAAEAFYAVQLSQFTDTADTIVRSEVLELLPIELGHPMCVLGSAAVIGSRREAFDPDRSIGPVEALEVVGTTAPAFDVVSQSLVNSYSQAGQHVLQIALKDPVKGSANLELRGSIRPTRDDIDMFVDLGFATIVTGFDKAYELQLGNAEDQ